MASIADVPELIRERLRALRAEQGISRSVLSRRTAREGDEGVAEITIKTIETEPGSLPRARTIELLSAALGVPPESFYEYPIAKAKADAKSGAETRLEGAEREEVQQARARQRAAPRTTRDGDAQPGHRRRG